jgi:hypothetical protein
VQRGLVPKGSAHCRNMWPHPLVIKPRPGTRTMRVFTLCLLAMIGLLIWLAPPFEARERRLRIEAEPPKPETLVVFKRLSRTAAWRRSLHQSQALMMKLDHLPF